MAADVRLRASACCHVVTNVYEIVGDITPDEVKL